MATSEAGPVTGTVEHFIARWAGSTGTEQSNAQMFLYELCSALELPIPDTEGDEAHGNAYVFERTMGIRI